jgi:hypothetical protein
VPFLNVHALKRMEQRGISRSEVLQALTRRETVYVSDEDASRTVILGSTSEGRRLKVIVESDDEQCVVTVSARDEEG